MKRWDSDWRLGGIEGGRGGQGEEVVLREMAWWIHRVIVEREREGGKWC